MLNYLQKRFAGGLSSKFNAIATFLMLSWSAVALHFDSSYANVTRSGGFKVLDINWVAVAPGV